MTKLCPRGKAAAKRKFKVYPSAYANAYASKICAGKIKDPSGVKRKDFKGPKPAAKGRMIKAATGAALGAISAGAGAIGAAALRGNKRIADKKAAKKRDKAKVQKKMMGGMTAGSQSALGRIQKANMVKAREGEFVRRRMLVAGKRSKSKGMGTAKDYQKYLKGLKNIRDKSLPGILAKPEYNPTVYDQKTFERAGGKGKAKFKDYKGLGVKNEDEFFKRRMKLAGTEALKAAKATRIGKIAAGVAGAALLGKAALEKMYEKRTGKKPFTKRRKLVDKKSKGGDAKIRKVIKGLNKASKLHAGQAKSLGTIVNKKSVGGMADYYKDLM